MRGLFISLEGIDGAGKSTHVNFMREYLEDKGFSVILAREPGGTLLGEKVRNLLLHENGDIHRVTELCLLFASRQELISKVIEPNLAKGVCVIADRFIDASIAYQGYGRKIGVDKLAKIIALLEPQLTTDLTLLFDLPLEVALSRVAKNKNKDRIEREDAEFFASVQDGYRQIAAENAQRVKIIQTNQKIDTVRVLIVHHLEELLERYSATGNNNE